MKREFLEPQLAKILNEADKSEAAEVVHLTAEDQLYNGRELTIHGKKHLNFASCSYLGLALDARVVKGTIDGAKRFGTSFPTSRSFVTLGYIEELEAKLEVIFGYSCIVTTSTSLAHAAFLPLFINQKDAFICDHQVHTSIRVASEMIRAKGCAADIIRHSDMNSLEEKIQLHSKTRRNVWYFADGIYSMYGDKAPMSELNRLLDTYENFHVYIDDAHGMSWTGKNGKGYVLSDFPLHTRMVLSTSLGKAFGSIGGVLVCNNPELKRMIKVCGSSFIFSSPVPPSVIGASMAAAEIHLSPEIETLQANLVNRIHRFKQLASEANLPILGKGDTPIFFIPSGNTKTCFALSKRMMDRGFYQSSAVYPSVPENSAGIRLTLTNWLQMEDIEKMVDILSTERELLLREEQLTEYDLKRNFKGIDYNINV